MIRHEVPGGTVTVRRRTIEWQFRDLVDPENIWNWAPGGPNTEGTAQIRAWVDRLFYDAEQVRGLSKRHRMRAGYGGSSGCVRFAGVYTASEVAQWARELVDVLGNPSNLHRLA